MPAKRTFWERVNKNGKIMRPELGPCHEWTGATRGGYGRIQVDGKTLSAHVYAFEVVHGHGPLPPGKKVLHRCDNEPCVRDEHLFSGTQHENVLDSVMKGRHKNPVMHGSSNPNAVITEEAVRALRANPPKREEKMKVAASLGISRRSLNRLLQGARWKKLG